MEEKVLKYIEKRSQWKEALTELRSMILVNDQLKEEIKWGAPVYTLDGKNVVGLVGVKSYVGLWFYMGVFLSDPDHLLERSSDKTKGLRKMMFHSIEEFREHKAQIGKYILEAIENQKAGKEIRPNRSKKLVISPELQAALSDDPDLNTAFDLLTPGKKREYAEHVESAKQTATKLRRIEKMAPLILTGKGLHDKYK